jgi:hypothetical protein
MPGGKVLRGLGLMIVYLKNDEVVINLFAVARRNRNRLN